MTTTEGRPIETLTEDEIPQLRNIPVYADGDEIGHVGDIYYDEDGGRVQCVAVKGDALGFQRQWIPAQGAVLRDDGLYLSYGRDRVANAPRWDDDDLDEARYGEVREHFVTRHEEELQVGKREQQAGAVRLRKWVETEPASAEVELKRETARVTREPVDEPLARDADAFTEQEVEVPLSAEEPVVAKQVVAKERVGVEKGVETDRHTVQDEVRKERVEVEGDGDVEKQ